MTVRPTLDGLALKHGTDKASDKHGYTRVYQHLFEPLRDQPITLLELGWGGHDGPYVGGESARMWRDYFTEAQVIVLDADPKTNDVAGVDFYQTDQADAQNLGVIHDTHGDFDIIIDDASHLSSLTIKSFEILFPWLKPGGLYVVEDTHMAYHDFFYGPQEANADPDRRRSDGSPTMMQYFRRLADEANFRGRCEWDLFPAQYSWGVPVEWIAFFFNLVVVCKREGSGEGPK